MKRIKLLSRVSGLLRTSTWPLVLDNERQSSLFSARRRDGSTSFPFAKGAFQLNHSRAMPWGDGGLDLRGEHRVPSRLPPPSLGTDRHLLRQLSTPGFRGPRHSPAPLTRACAPALMEAVMRWSSMFGRSLGMR